MTLLWTAALASLALLPPRLAAPLPAQDLPVESPAEEERDSNAEAELELGEQDAVGLPAASTSDIKYSSDLSDAALEEAFVRNLESLGSISVGLAEAGRVVNAVPMPQGEHWTVVSPEAAFGTQETIDFLQQVAEQVAEQLPDSPPLRINHLSKKNGGYLRPHQSHQSGRDADLGFYYRDGMGPGALRVRREHALDLAANWELVRTLATQTDVQVILVDRRIQKVLRAYAEDAGEDRAFLDSLFSGQRTALLQHARGHRDHFHVRFFAPRSQELGRRIIPLLAKVPEENAVIHRVRRGDTLGHLASRYGTTVRSIQKANGLPGTFLKLGRTLRVPLRGPCTNCPIPPPLEVPPRRAAPDRPKPPTA